MNVKKRLRLDSIADINPESLDAYLSTDRSFRYIDISSVERGVIDWQSVKTYTLSDAPSRARRIVRPSDVLLCTVRPGLQAHAFASWSQTDGFVCSTGFAVVRAKESADPRFIFHAIFGDDVQAQMRRLEMGSNYPAINERDVSSLELPAFSKNEQSAIAEVLATVDAAIEQTEALIAKYKRIKTGLMHDLLTRGIDEHGRLRDPATHAFKDSPLGRIPVEWEVKFVSGITSFVGSGITPTGGEKVYTSSGVLFIRSQNVYNDGLRLDDVAFINDVIDQRMSRTRVLSGDVLLNITGASIGRCCFVPDCFPPANVNQHVCILRQTNRTSSDACFLANTLSSPIGQLQIKSLNAGGNREGLNYQQVKSIQVPYPSEVERIAIANYISQTERLIKNEQVELQKLRRLSTGLMQDLLTGRVSVSPLLGLAD